MTSTRILVLLLCLAAAGCTKPTSFPDPKQPAPYKADAPSPVLSVPGPAAPTDPAGAARAFLAAANAGTATAAQLTPEFKRVIAPAVFAADQANGYSDAVADEWLKQFRGRLPSPTLNTMPGNGFTGSAG